MKNSNTNSVLNKHEYLHKSMFVVTILNDEL